MVQPLRPAEQIRLAAGHHLYVGEDGGWRLAGPADSYERLRLPVAVGAALERLLTGRAGYAAAAAAAGDTRLLDAALQTLRERGLLTDAGAADEGAEPRPDSRPVMVLGEGSVAQRVADLLGSAGHRVRRDACAPGSGTEVRAPELEGAGVVVSCASWLPDRAWQHLDARCGRAALAWHRCHREGSSLVLGPFSIPRRTADYRDTRARRLAAASRPAELAALWRHLDTSPPPATHPDAATSAVVAGILAADVIAFLGGRPIPTEGAALVIDPATMMIDRHPVLPLPAEVVDGWTECAESAGGQGAPS